MAELVKPWNDGGSLSVAYEGSGDGEAIFSSDSYEGIDREQSVIFKDVNNSVSVERTVRQEGIRQKFITADGKVFCVTDGGRFGVLRSGFEPDVPDEPIVETYTRLTYIECTAEQYFNSNYYIQETDTIEAYYETKVASEDKFLYAATGSQGGVWLSLYSTYAYVRFGNTSSKSIQNGAINHYIKVKKNSVVLDVTTTTLTYEGMPTGPLYVFGGYNASSGLYNAYTGKCTMLKITGGDGNVVMELRPVKRDSDGKVGMLDIVSGTFFINEGSGADFIGGREVRVTDDYELIDRVAFNNDVAFDTGFYGNEKTYIDVMFQRTDISGADYLFGCSSGNRLTAYCPASGSGYWRYGSAYPTFTTASKKIYVATVTPTKTTVDRTSGSISTSAFTTSWTLPLGGHKGSTNTITKSFQGYVYYFRMKHGVEQLLDWYPCRRKSDGVEGFWDCITQTFVESL